MIAPALAALLLGQVHAWASLGTGWILPDPFAVVLAWAGLTQRRSDLPWAALLLGWARALVLAEPLGGHLLSCGAALLALESLRASLDGRRLGGQLVAVLASTLVLQLAGWALRGLSGAPLTAGWPLLAGAALVLPALVPLRAAAARARRRPA